MTVTGWDSRKPLSRHIVGLHWSDLGRKEYVCFAQSGGSESPTRPYLLAWLPYDAWSWAWVCERLEVRSTGMSGRKFATRTPHFFWCSNNSRVTAPVLTKLHAVGVPVFHSGRHVGVPVLRRTWFSHTSFFILARFLAAGQVLFSLKFADGGNPALGLDASNPRGLWWRPPHVKSTRYHETKHDCKVTKTYTFQSKTHGFIHTKSKVPKMHKIRTIR